MTIVVFEEDTKEILAVIRKDRECITKKGIDFRIYEKSEPIFTDREGKIYLDDKWLVNKGEDLWV